MGSGQLVDIDKAESGITLGLSGDLRVACFSYSERYPEIQSKQRLRCNT